MTGKRYYLVLAALFALAGCIIFLCSAALADECLPSLHAARQAHPTAHISWSGGCYYAGRPGQRHVAHRERRDVTTGAAPAPQPRRMAVAGPADPPRRVQVYRLRHVAEFDAADSREASATTPVDVTFDRSFSAPARADSDAPTSFEDRFAASGWRSKRELVDELDRMSGVIAAMDAEIAQLRRLVGSR